MLPEILFILGYGFGDTITTYQIYNYNNLYEANPITRLIINHFGFIGIVIIKILFISYVLIRPIDITAIWLMATFGFIVTIWNTIQIRKAINDT